MERCCYVAHRGKQILIMDCSQLQPGDFGPIIDECARKVQSKQHNSVLTLTIAGGGRFDSDTVQRLQTLTKDNAPYVRKSAIVGITGLQHVVLTTVSLFSNRKFNLFNDLEEAKDFLAAD